MKKYNPQQCLADMLSNIETARDYVGEMTADELRGDVKTLDATLRRLENASEAHSRLWNKTHGWPEIAKEIEARHPEVPWRHFQSLANRYRHDYDVIEVELVWKVLQPGDILARVQAAMKEELVLSQVSSIEPRGIVRHPPDAAIVMRSETFAQSMRCRIVDLDPTEGKAFEGRLAWVASLPGSEESLALIQVGSETTYRRIQATNVEGIKIGDMVTVQSSEHGLTISRNEQQQSQSLRPRIT